MASDRMYLAHVPSRRAVYLGKRFGPDSGWYNVPPDLADLVDKLFDAAGPRARQEGFRVLFEDNEEGIGIGPPIVDVDDLRVLFLSGDPEEEPDG